MSNIKFKKPLAGTFLCLTDDKIERGLDKVDCLVEAPKGHRVLVNGTVCEETEEGYRVSLPLTGVKMDLTALDETTGESACSWVYRIHIPQKVYRVSVDDNIWWLQDLAKNQDRYVSIFENPYLAMYRKLHEAHGTKFHFNIYYTCPEHGGFSLPELSDKFRDEFLAVNDWMTLSFHAKANEPCWPYSTASYEQVYTECKQVMDEIERFAGYRGAVTTLHFADCTPDGARALYDCGVRALLGDFEVMKEGGRRLGYYLNDDEEKFFNVRCHSFWKEPETNMIYFPCDSVINTFTPEEIPGEQDLYEARYPDRAFLDLLIHEQYFYEDYENYLPDYEERIRAGILWCEKHGYVPGLVKDIIDFNAPEFRE